MSNGGLIALVLAAIGLYAYEQEQNPAAAVAPSTTTTSGNTSAVFTGSSAGPSSSTPPNVPGAKLSLYAAGQWVDANTGNIYNSAGTIIGAVALATIGPVNTPTNTGNQSLTLPPVQQNIEAPPPPAQNTTVAATQQQAQANINAMLLAAPIAVNTAPDGAFPSWWSNGVQVPTDGSVVIYTSQQDGDRILTQLQDTQLNSWLSIPGTLAGAFGLAAAMSRFTRYIAWGGRWYPQVMRRAA